MSVTLAVAIEALLLEGEGCVRTVRLPRQLVEADAVLGRDAGLFEGASRPAAARAHANGRDASSSAATSSARSSSRGAATRSRS